jgi:chromate transporter
MVEKTLSIGRRPDVAWQLFRAAVVDWTTLLLAVIAFVLLLRFRLNSTWLVLGGAMVGMWRVWAHF